MCVCVRCVLASAAAEERKRKMAKCERFVTPSPLTKVSIFEEERWQLDQTDRQPQTRTMRDRMEWHQSATLRVAHRKLNGEREGDGEKKG